MLLGNTTVTVITRAAGTYTREGYQPGAATSSTVASCSVQPLSANDVAVLPERLQARAQLKMYAPVNSPIVSAFERDGTLRTDRLPDLVVVDGTKFRAYRDNSYRHFLIQHVKYVLILPESHEERPDAIS